MTVSTFEQQLAAFAAQRGIAVPTVEQREAHTGAAAELPAALREAADAALASYRASDDYAALIADMPGIDLPELHARLGAALNGPIFAPVVEMVSDPAAFSLPSWILAISLGIEGEAAIVLGVGANVGYVMNPTKIPANLDARIYIGGEFDLGVTLQGGPCLGFWTYAPDDITGFYVGVEADVPVGSGDATATVSALARFEEGIKGVKKGVLFVGTSMGLPTPTTALCFFFHLNVGRHAPIYQSGRATYLVQFGTITCTNSKDNYDTISLNFYQDNDATEYRFPAWNGYQMAEKGNDSQCYQWDMGLLAQFDSQLTLYLQVGNHQMPAQSISAGSFSGVGGTHTVTFKDTVNAFDDIEYSVVVTLMKG